MNQTRPSPSRIVFITGADQELIDVEKAMAKLEAAGFKLMTSKDVQLVDFNVKGDLIQQAKIF